MKKQLIIYCSGLLFLSLGACKSLDHGATVQEQALPAHFGSHTDSTNTADMDWRTFFGDPHLNQLIDTALVGNLDLRMALQRIEVSRSSVRFSKGELLPKLEGRLSVGLDKYARYTTDHAGNSTTEYAPGKIVPNPLSDHFVGLASSWELDLWGRLKSGRKAALSNLLASLEGHKLVVSNLVAEIAEAYYGLVSLDRELEIIGRTLERQRASLELMLLLKETGRANELAVQQFRSQLLDSRALEQEKTQQILETEHRINFLLGRFPRPIARNGESLDRELPPRAAPGRPYQLLANRPDIREAEFLLEASKFDLKVAKAAFFPKLDLGANVGFQAFKTQFLFQGSESVGYSILGGITAPLLNRNAIKAQFSVAKAEQLESIYHYQKTVLNAFMEVSIQLGNLERLQEIQAQREQQAEILGQSISTSSALFASARAGYLEILIAEQNLLGSQLALVDVKLQQQLAAVQLYRALGGGWQ